MSKKQYTRSYKLDAVKLTIQGDDSIAQTAINLGVHKATMYQLVSKYRSEVMQNGVSLTPDQYVSEELEQILDKNKVTISMSRKGNCWDNAVSESFFGTLKQEMIHHEKYKNLEEVSNELV